MKWILEQKKKSLTISTMGKKEVYRDQSRYIFEIITSLQGTTASVERKWGFCVEYVGRPSRYKSQAFASTFQYPLDVSSKNNQQSTMASLKMVSNFSMLFVFVHLNKEIHVKHLL
jgi:hypothetical protein